MHSIRKKLYKPETGQFVWPDHYDCQQKIGRKKVRQRSGRLNEVFLRYVPTKATDSATTKILNWQVCRNKNLLPCRNRLSRKGSRDRVRLIPESHESRASESDTFVEFYGVLVRLERTLAGGMDRRIGGHHGVIEARFSEEWSRRNLHRLGRADKRDGRSEEYDEQKTKKRRALHGVG
jgi:hypothetical protein